MSHGNEKGYDIKFLIQLGSILVVIVSSWVGLTMQSRAQENKNETQDVQITSNEKRIREVEKSVAEIKTGQGYILKTLEAQTKAFEKLDNRLRDTEYLRSAIREEERMYRNAVN